jgi:hypothetical protein
VSFDLDTSALGAEAQVKESGGVIVSTGNSVAGAVLVIAGDVLIVVALVSKGGCLFLLPL